MFHAKLYLLTIPVFFIIDILWLGFVARGIYKAKMGHLMGETRWEVAILFYLIFIVGILYFSVLPALEMASWKKAAIDGAIFGFITYATFDLTSLAVIKDFPTSIVWIDMLWGTVLCALVASVSFQIGMWLKV